MNKTIIYTSLFLAILALGSCSSVDYLTQATENKQPITRESIAQTESFNYQDYALVLANYVNDRGLVDYSALQANRQSLDRFNQSLAEVDVNTYQSWSESEQLAFLINAYNSLTLQSIIDREPLEKSIRDIPGVWKIRKFQVAGSSKTLDNIEHDTIRKDFNEPRIHAALVCAAMSCPPLRNEPYLPDKLDEQLDEQVNKFINSPQGFKLDRQENKVYLSSIFKWYGKDWIDSYNIKDKFAGSRKEKAVLNFLSNYLSPEERQYLEKGRYKVIYLDYDWSLNKQ